MSNKSSFSVSEFEECLVEIQYLLPIFSLLQTVEIPHANLLWERPGGSFFWRVATLKTLKLFSFSSFAAYLHCSAESPQSAKLGQVAGFTNALGVRVDYSSSQICGCTCDVPLQLHYEMLQLALMSTMETLPWRMFLFFMKLSSINPSSSFFNQYLFILYHLLRFCLVNLLPVMKSSWPLFRLKGFPSISAISLGVQVRFYCLYLQLFIE